MNHFDAIRGKLEQYGIDAMLLTEEYPEADMNKVIRMCLIHDLGEAFTGDIPTFDKTEADTQKEDALFDSWVQTLPAETRQEFSALLAEMNALETVEAKIYKALDKMEAVIQHNLSDLSTWIPLEYELNKTYANDKVAFSDTRGNKGTRSRYKYGDQGVCTRTGL